MQTSVTVSFFTPLDTSRCLSKQLYDAFPALMKHLPGPHNRIFSNSKSLEASIRAEIERHKLDLDPSNPRDYIDTFLLEERVWCS